MYGTIARRSLFHITHLPAVVSLINKLPKHACHDFIKPGDTFYTMYDESFLLAAAVSTTAMRKDTLICSRLVWLSIVNRDDSAL